LLAIAPLPHYEPTAESRNAMKLKNRHNEEMIELLFTCEDRLTREEADEMIRRGEELIPLLGEIIIDRAFWTVDLPEWWAPVHATYILASIGGKSSVIPLMAALRWSDAYDNEWVTEDLPSILGSLGEISFTPVKSVVADKSAGWSARSIAMDALGSHALLNPTCEEECMKILAQIVDDPREEFGARRSAAFVLVDFRRSDYKRALIGFSQAEENYAKADPNYKRTFTIRDLEKDLSAARSGLEMYTRDWMEFYSPEQIHKRKELWEKSDRGETQLFGDIPDKHGQQKWRTLGGRSVIMDLNGPCPCGSGRPYKRCCWKKVH